MRNEEFQRGVRAYDDIAARQREAKRFVAGRTAATCPDCGGYYKDTQAFGWMAVDRDRLPDPDCDHPIHEIDVI